MLRLICFPVWKCTPFLASIFELDSASSSDSWLTIIIIECALNEHDGDEFWVIAVPLVDDAESKKYATGALPVHSSTE